MFAVCHIGEPGGRCSATESDLSTPYGSLWPLVTVKSLVYSLLFVSNAAESGWDCEQNK